MSEINDMLSPDGITVTGQAVAETSNDDTAIDTKPDILFISGSPRRRASVALVGLLEQGARKAGAKTQHFFLCERHINPCIGCGSCEKTGICAFADRKVDGQLIDDYLELKALLDRVDAVGIVAPLYFAGPTAQFKALLDRLQPYYAQRYLLGHKKMPKRPAHLYVVGSGGDPHGYAPLVGTTRSAFNVAGFMIEKVHDFVGFLSPQDTSALYDGLDRDNTPATTELVRLRRAVARQEEFEARAISAGGAFARYVVKQQEANQLAAQLEEIKAEMEELKSVGDRVSPRLAESSPIIYDSRDEIELEYLNLIRRGRDRGREVSFSRDDAVGDDIDSADVVSDDAIGDDAVGDDIDSAEVVSDDAVGDDILE